MNDVIKMQWANIEANEKFFCIETCSGYAGASMRDTKGKRHLLSHDADDSQLGEALIDALAHSRFVLPERRTDVWTHPEAEYDAELYDHRSSQKAEQYKAWIKELLVRYGYKSQRAMFRKMNNCRATQYGSKIHIAPSHHETSGGWSGDGFTEADTVVVSENSSTTEIGAAIRLALSRCTSAIA